MLGVALQIAVIVVLTLLNGLFAMSETALVSSRKAQLRQRAEAGDKGARAALALADSPTRFLSTVQIGISLIGVLAGAFGGAALPGPLRRAPRLRRRGGGYHLPLPHHRRARAQAPRAQRPRDRGLARGGPYAPPLGGHRPGRLVPERLDRIGPRAARGTPDRGGPGQRAGGRDTHGGGRQGGRLRGGREGPRRARPQARRPPRARAYDAAPQRGVARRG